MNLSSNNTDTSDPALKGGSRRFPRLRAQSANRTGRFQRNSLARGFGSGTVAHAASTSQLDAVAGAGVAPNRQKLCPGAQQGTQTVLSTLSAREFSTDDGVAGALADSGSEAESVLSEFDLVNDTIQEFLLASDNSDDDSVFSGDFGDSASTATVYFSTLLPVAGSGSPSVSDGVGRRRRMAKKSASSTTLSTLNARGPHGGLSTGSLFGLEKELECPGEGGKWGMRTRRRVVQIRNACAGAAPSAGTICGRASQQQQRAALLRPLRTVHRGVPVGPLSIVFDVDETLVSARQGPIFVRPHVKALLDLCEELRCEIIVWTAGVASYVNPILHAIADACRRKAWFHHIISRHRRWYSEDSEREGSGVKDLRLLGRPLERVLLIENNPVSVCRQPRNSILVEDYLQPNERDESLRVLADILRRTVLAMASSVSQSVSSTVAKSRQPSARGGEGPMPASAIPVADVLDREDALQFAEFDLDDFDDRESGGEEEEASAERYRHRSRKRSSQAPSTPFSRCCGPHFPSGSESVDSHDVVADNEEESARRQPKGHQNKEAAVLKTQQQSILVGPAQQSSLDDDEVAGDRGKKVRCRVLGHSSISPFIGTRSYGCLTPTTS